MDKLVKVWLKTGEERWLLIHIEVQASKEGDFPKRMYVYNHRIFDRYDREVISLAILADDDPDWRPSRYEYSRWGFRTSTEFPIVKLLDYAPKYQKLEADPNPFAVVVLAHLKALETRRSPADRQAWKVRLVKGLYERGMDPEDVRQLFRFIDWVMELPEPLEELFWEEIDAYQQEKRYAVHRHRGTEGMEKGMKKGMEEGMKKGIEKGSREGIEKGIEKGMEKGLLRGIEACLKVKFGAEGLELMPELRQIRDHALLVRSSSGSRRRTAPMISVACGPGNAGRRRSRRTDCRRHHLSLRTEIGTPVVDSLDPPADRSGLPMTRPPTSTPTQCMHDHPARASNRHIRSHLSGKKRRTNCSDATSNRG